MTTPTPTPAPIHTAADPAHATTRHTRHAQHPRTTRSHPAATTQPRPTTGLPDVPSSIPALIAKIVQTLTWDKTLQVAFLVGVTALAVTLVLIVLAYTLSAVPPIWSAIASLIAGGEAITITYHRTTTGAPRRRRRRT
jgi:hypothetical protein